MSRKHSLPIAKIHVEIYEEDRDYLEGRFGRHTTNAIGVGPAIRQIVHAKVRALRDKEIEALDQMAPGEDLANREIARKIVGASY